MSQSQPQWQIQPTPEIPEWFLETVKNHIPNLDGRYAAQLLWQRGIQNPQKLAGFINPDLYQPATPFEFGQEMKLAVRRLQKAREVGEKVAIWGDFDADGITATSVLWEGLGQFFTQNQELIYYIPNRITESHGLNNQGISKLAEWGSKLIVTCDTGSTNLTEIEYAQSLGIDIIITDHHTLPEDRPPVVSIINPRYFVEKHPLFHLSGVAVAYKLVEALYQSLPDIPRQPVEDLLDLVAIGLIADLVQLSGDCRYLAQRGIQRLQQQMKTRTRPGVAKLLELCQRNGDRPTDISFGIGPRINAVSRIQGDASFCVELLTSRDEKRTNELAIATELANSRRKSLQKDVTQQVKNKLAQLDLSTTSVIVLEDPQWAVGVLGLVAGQIAQEYGLPTILLSTASSPADPGEEEWEIGEIKEMEKTKNSPLPNTESADPLPTPHSPLPTPHLLLARGSARSVNNIDLYELVNSQAHLLHRFGGHPFAAGLSLLVENIPLFTDAINQQLRHKLSSNALSSSILKADLVVNVAELGKELFQELKLLEPCGMGNSAPKLLIENCWFQEVRNRNTQDFKGGKVQYIKTELEVWDDSCDRGFPGIWWGHYQDEVPKGRCSCLVELDYNNYKKRPEFRIVAVHSQDKSSSFNFSTQIDWILDWRGEDREIEYNLPNESQTLLPLTPNLLPENDPLTMRQSPISWDEVQLWFRRAIQTERKLAIAYPPPHQLPPEQIWYKLVGIAKFISRTRQSATLEQLHEKLNISDRTLRLGIIALESIGFQVKHLDWAVEISCDSGELSLDKVDNMSDRGIQLFLAAVEEEQFLRQYFYQVALPTIETMVAPMANC